jgi:hypothetical protein
MPLATAHGVSAAYRGMLYVATLCDDGAACGSYTGGGALWRYNPATDRWALLTGTPHDPFAKGGGFIGGKFYLSGPPSGAVWLMDVYDPATNTWSAAPSAPAACGPAATLQAKLYFVGCNDGVSYEQLMLVFDPGAGTWSQAATPPVATTGWHTLSRVFLNRQPRLQLIGGAGPGNNWQFQP